MLFSKDVLFIHVPKTGGMSVTRYLLEVLPRPIYYAHPAIDEKITDKDIVQIPGKRHESLEEAKKVVSEYGFDIFEFPLILAVLRNPYSLEVSRYTYLQIGHPWDAGPEQQLALNEDFEAFVLQSSYKGGFGIKVEGYFLLDGKFPRNLQIIKFENLVEGVREALRKVGVEKVVDFPWVNRSHHDDFLSYYTHKAEEAVYQRYKWVFDCGFYERIKLRNFNFVKDMATYGHKLPIVGPVRQVGPSSGFWPDQWVGGTLRFLVNVQRPISRVSIEGWLPDKFDTKNELVLTINGQRAAASFESGKSFAWDVPCDVVPGTRIQIELTTSATWCPREAGASKDGRQLSFRLRCIIFEQLTDVIRKVVRTVLPPDATVIVVSKGDDELLKLDGRQAWHFPQTEAGVYAGYYPIDSVEAITHLETLRTKGGSFLLFPNTAFWWLDYYGDFRQHLDTCYRRVWSDKHCLIYQLS